MGLAAGRTWRRAASGWYVVVVTVSMGLAMIDPNDPEQPLLVAACVLCLPAMVLALPVFYVVVATAWNLTDADNGGSTWPVTATYVVGIGLVAVANVWVARRVVGHWGRGPIT